MFEISNDVRRLSENEKIQYKSDGYITGLPVFANEARDDLNEFFTSLSSRVSSDIDINQTNMWHKASLNFYNLCRTPAILDYVEDLFDLIFFNGEDNFFLKNQMMDQLFHGIKTHSIGLYHQQNQLQFG